MKYNKARAVCAIFAGIILTGCSSGKVESGVSVADFGDSGGVNYSHEDIVSSEDIPAESKPISSASHTQDTSMHEPTQADDDSSEEHVSSPAEEPSAQQQTTTKDSSHVTETSVPSSETTAATEKTSAALEKTTVISTTTAETLPAEVPDYDFGSSTYTAVNYSEVKGIWISYIELSEILTGQSRDSFRKNISEVFDNCVSFGINTVYVHVRSHSDAYYRSELFPWSRYVTGTLGSDPGFDPLDIMINEAHSRGLSFQAWINPLRACSTSQLSSYGNYPVYSYATGTGTAGNYVVDVNGTYYLNPAYDEITELIAAGASEILANYDVDGLHIDDYFYPTTDASFDSSAYSASGYGSLSDFRFANCDRMVSELYSAVKSANPSAVFSVSVQGRIDNNYTQLYADVRKWCTNPGYLDVIIPQIYYGFENSAAPYQSTLDEWEKLAQRGGIPLVTGLSVSKIGIEDTWAGSGKYEWINNSDIISRQLSAAKKCGSYGGFALYSYRSIFSPDPAVSAAVNKEISALKDII